MVEVAWFFENGNNRSHRAGKMPPNELGLFGRSGNVREWVSDCRQDSYENVPDTGVAREQDDRKRRSIRGGAWYVRPNHLGTANRFWYTTDFRNNNLGLAWLDQGAGASRHCEGQ